MEAVVFVGIQASGKSSFYKDRFFATHVRISLDLLRTRNRERRLLKLCKNASVPQVSISGGYGVNQLAAAILNQAGDRLKAAKDQERQK